MPPGPGPTQAVPLSGNALSGALNNLRPGQTIQARVAAILDNGAVRLSTSVGTLEIRLPLSVPQGTTLALQLLKGDAGPVLQVSGLSINQGGTGKNTANNGALMDGMVKGGTLNRSAGQTSSGALSSTQTTAEQSRSAQQPMASAQTGPTQPRQTVPGAQPPASTASGVNLNVTTATTGQAAPAGSAAHTSGTARADGRNVAAQSAPSSPPGGSAEGVGTSVPRSPAAVHQQAVRDTLSDTISRDAARQTGMAPLFSTAAQILTQLPAGSLPPQVQTALANLLGFRLPTDKPPTTEGLRQAVARSGIFSEARLAQAPAPSATSPDMKTSMLSLRNALSQWLGSLDNPPGSIKTAGTGEIHPPPGPLQGSSADTAARPAPPSRGGLPLPQSASASLPFDAHDAEGGGQQLRQALDGALARLRLAQTASLRQGGGDDGAVEARGSQSSWHVELPLALGEKTAMLSLTIKEDTPEDASDAGPRDRHFRLRFALDLDALGPVHALILARGDVLNLTLWAERDETASLFRDASPLLESGLNEAAFEVHEMQIRKGAPDSAVRKAGHFLDRRS